MNPPDAPLVSFVTPAFNEEKNLGLVHARLAAVMRDMALDWEWIIVDDHSRDLTFAAITSLAQADPRVRGLRLSRNCGSHTAISCGLAEAQGDMAVVLSADCQDPPELIPRLVAQWRQGAQIVWAARAKREGETADVLFFARIYYAVMRHLVGLRDMPETGADYFLIDRLVIDALGRFPERNRNVLALLGWMGFRQSVISYDKKARAHGRSGWTLAKKIKLMIDSVTSFSFLPIRCISLLGVLLALLGGTYALWVLGNALFGHPVEGWSSLMVAVLVIGGVQCLMLGVLGEYIWRSLDEARGRPQYLIEDRTGQPGASVRLTGGQRDKPADRA